MILKKIAELYFKENDIYILENDNNTIIVNDNNQGLLLLDNSLHIQKQLTILQEASIYSLYKKYDGNAIVLYLPDAHQIVHIDLKTSNHYAITLPKAFDQEILSPNYYWDSNTLILTTFNNHFYQLDFTSHTLHPISNDTIERNYPSFFDFWNTCTKYNVLTVYPDKKCFIFQKSDSSIEYFDYQQNKHQTVIGFSDGWHDVEYNNGLFLFIHENKIELLHDHHKNIVTLHANFIFLKAKFIDNHHFVVLSSNPSNCQESLLEIYIIEF